MEVTGGRVTDGRGWGVGVVDRWGGEGHGRGDRIATWR